MCGRARCTLGPADVAAACGFQAPLNTLHAERFHPSYNVSPGSYMPVVRYHQEESSKSPTVHYMKWGLIPSFTKKSEQPDHFRMFNARSESVHEKASFRKLLPKCRCLATVEGFYEWKKDGTRKQPYYIHFKDGRPLVFAALFDCWTNSEGEVLYTFTILTTHSSKALEWLHDRMPVILGSKKAVDDWLNDDISMPSLQSVMQPYESQDMVWYPVNPAMGKTSFDGPECIKQMAETKNSISQLFSKQRSSVEPHSENLKAKVSAEEAEAKLPDGSLLNEKELKALLAAMEPDEDITLRKTDSKAEKETEPKGQCTLTPPKSNTQNTSSYFEPPSAIHPFHEETKTPFKTPDGKGSKRKQSLVPSPDVKTKVPATGRGDRQRSLLNFFGKQ